LWPFGNFVVNWYICSQFWYIVPRRIWQPRMSANSIVASSIGAASSIIIRSHRLRSESWIEWNYFLSNHNSGASWNVLR
jgi:hypothetical protein